MSPARLALAPAVGLAVGLAAALVAGAVATVAPWLGGLSGVLVLEALGGGAGRRILPPALGLAALGAKVAAALSVPLSAHRLAFVLAGLLGRWAIVVQCHGGVRARSETATRWPIGRAGFREFGWASVVAFAVTLALAEAAGLVLLVLAAGLTLGLRVLAHRRHGGLGDRLVALMGDLVETVVLLGTGLLAGSGG